MSPTQTTTIRFATVVGLMVGLWSVFAAPADSGDRLAADVPSAAFRTGAEDERVARVPADIERGIFRDARGHLRPLVQFLIAGTTNEFHKTKRIHDWITRNIAYDSDAFEAQKPEPTDVSRILGARRTTCGGFARLFKEMATLAGVEVISIPGISRRRLSIKRNRMAGHIWSAARIGGKWYIVDATGDNRFHYRDSAFSRLSSYRDWHLFISPQAKIMMNRPEKEEHQFLETPVSEAAFLNAPFIEMSVLKYGVRFVTDVTALVKRENSVNAGGTVATLREKASLTKNVLSFTLDVPHNVTLHATVTDPNRKPQHTHALCSRDRARRNTATCRFSAPGTGMFKATISARWNSPREPSTFRLYEFMVQGLEGAGPRLPLPNELHVTDAIAKYGVDLVATGPRVFEVRHPRGVDVFVGIYEQGIEEVKVPAEGTILSTTGNSARWRFVVPAYSKEEYFIKVKAKKSSESRYTDVLAVMRVKGP